MIRRVLPIVLGFVLLAAVAVAGWVRTPAQAAPLLPPNTAWDNNCAGSAAPAADTAYTPYDNGPQVHRAYYSQAPAQRVVERRYYQPRTTTTYVAPRRGRPLSHSVAIVGGGAGVGAAIGGLAGGGRGAAIGALSGGGLGFLYDRLTHNR